MSYQNYLIDAIDTVAAWDIPDESFGLAVRSQAFLMAGFEPNEVIGCYED